MTYNAIFLRLGVVACFLGSIAGYAKPPKPGIQLIAQTDGTTVPVRVHGDMHHHFMTDTAGYPLIRENGVLFYADTDKHGKLRSTGRRAGSPATRTALPTVAERDRMLRSLELRGDSIREAAAPQDSETNSLSPLPGLYPGSNFPSTGSHPVLIILVDTPDVPFIIEDPLAHFTAMATHPGFSDYGATGSIADYFSENSSGNFSPEFVVCGPVTMPEDMAYYGQNDTDGEERHVWEMVVEACRQLDGELDFSRFDSDGDGKVDNVYIYYSGKGESSTNNENDIWPHAWSVSALTKEPVVLDGVRIDHYACSNEWESDPYSSYEGPDGIGTFIHEFSHVMGLPDLYPTSASSTSFTPQDWSVLDVGCYNNHSRTPPNYSSFERGALGWLEPLELSGPCEVSLPQITENVAAIIRTESENEFFLFENRQKSGWDKYLPYHGMLVWHIDYDKSAWRGNRVNNDASRQRVDLIEADNKHTLNTLRGDSFPGTSKRTSFSFTTKPQFATWDGSDPGLSITDIAETDKTVTFKVSLNENSGVDPIKGQSAVVKVSGRYIILNGATPGTPVSLHSVSGTPVDNVLTDSDGCAVLKASAKGMYILSGSGLRPVKIMVE